MQTLTILSYRTVSGWGLHIIQRGVLWLLKSSPQKNTLNIQYFVFNQHMLTFFRLWRGLFRRRIGTSRLKVLLLGAFLIAWLYFCRKSVAVVLKSDIFFQQVFIEQEPETPWHLHLSFIRDDTASIPTWNTSEFSNKFNLEKLK